MTEDIKAEVIKQTQDALGKYIKKPILTEKLLRKPPFRFLHDICTSAMRETGFLEGILNSVEVKAENIKDKDGKIAFLQKVIAAVEAANGIKLTVRPNKVVAGHEPTRTNEFLQALGKALEKQLENGNETKSTQPKSKNKTTKKPAPKEELQTKKKTSIIKPQKTQKPVENGEIKHKSKNNSDQVPSPKHSKKSEVVPSQNDENTEDVNSVKEKTKPRKNGFVENKVVLEETETRIDSSAKKTKGLEAGEILTKANVDDFRASGTEGQGDNEVNNQNVASNHDSEVKRPLTARIKHRKPSAHDLAERSKGNVEAAETSEREESNRVERVLGEKNGALNRSDSIRGDTTRATPTPPPVPTKDANPIRDGNNILSRPRTGIRPTTARPSSARPAAPRIRDRGDVTIHEEVIKPVSGKVKVIEDKATSNDQEDEDNVVSLETSNDGLLEDEPIKLQPADDAAVATQGEHGHLVEQILEVQKELEDDTRLATSADKKIFGRTEIQWESSRNRENSNREVERLRSSIQTLTRSANPLGKLLDFLQEDVDTMQRELDNWKEINASLQIQIAQERSLTDQSIEPLKIHLKELHQSVEEQIQKMSVVKANIIRNDQKIHKLMSGT